MLAELSVVEQRYLAVREALDGAIAQQPELLDHSRVFRVGKARPSADAWRLVIDCEGSRMEIPFSLAP